jgi:predicted nucleotidyltransferase
MNGMSAETKAGVLMPGEAVCFADRDDLLDKLDRMDIEVPGRKEGRRREHREHFVMRGYLRFLAGEDLLPLPVTLRKSPPNQDPPDFVLEWPDGRRESFELTEGSTREYQQRLTAAARAGDRLVLPIDISTSTREASALWAEILFSSFREKATALTHGRYSIDHLLIYDITGLGVFSPLADGVPLLRSMIDEWLRRERPTHSFARVSILRDFNLLLDLTGQARLLAADSPCFRFTVRADDDDDRRHRLRELDRYCREHSIRYLKLFGSARKRDLDEDERERESLRRGFDEHSDVDLLVEFEPGTTVTLFDMARMERELGELIGRTVDLRTAGDLSRYFREEVLREAVALNAP